LYTVSENQLYLSNLLDFYFRIFTDNLPYSNDWFRFFLASVDTTATYYYIPELTLIGSSVINDFILTTTTTERLVINLILTSENLVTGIMYAPQYILIVYILVAFFVLFFNFYISSTREDSILDQDYLIALSLIESEEEISSLDDILGALLFFIYVFF